MFTGLPDEVGGAVPVLPEEIRMVLYKPAPEEWPRGDCDATCRRIIQGLDQVSYRMSFIKKVKYIKHTRFIMP